MKKAISILAVAVMAFGLTTFVVENSTNEFSFLDDVKNLIACEDCYGGSDPRGGDNKIA